MSRIRPIPPHVLFLAAAGLLFAWLPSVSSAEGNNPQPIVFAAILLFGLGVPHGCFDHEVYRLARQKSGQPVRMARFLLGYSAIAAGYAAVWIVSPLAGLASFVLLTWFHWGEEDLLYRETVLGRPVAGRTERAATIVARGGLPMALPLAADPGAVQEVFAWILGLFPATAAIPSTAAVFACGLAGSLLTLIAAAWLARASGEGRGRDLLETGFLAAFFLLLHPLLSISLYFLFWHSIRHFELMASKFQAEVRSERRRLLGSGLAILALTALLLAALVPAFPDIVDFKAFLGLLLVFICCITLPHTLTMRWIRTRR